MEGERGSGDCGGGGVGEEEKEKRKEVGKGGEEKGAKGRAG